ncbi:hypothetical protein TOK_0237 [Pseudonocardia sp. N23]|nr:hypothetical protein TOK_0237 [Pseudonocardia sp. N23]
MPALTRRRFLSVGAAAAAGPALALAGCATGRAALATARDSPFEGLPAAS